MIHGKIAEFRTDKTYQPGFYLVKARGTNPSNCDPFIKYVWHIQGAGLSLFETSQSKQRAYSYSGRCRGIYCQTATGFNQTGQKICPCNRHVYQQSGQGGAGGFFSSKGSWPRNRDKLKWPIAMTGCGSKSSHRFTGCSSLISITTIDIYLLNQ